MRPGPGCGTAATDSGRSDYQRMLSLSAWLRFQLHTASMTLRHDVTSCSLLAHERSGVGTECAP